MSRQEQGRAGQSGWCYRTWCLTVVIRLLALQTCIALAYAQPAPSQQSVFKNDCLRGEVTASCERSYNCRSHLDEYTTPAKNIRRKHTHTTTMKLLHIKYIRPLTVRDARLATVQTAVRHHARNQACYRDSSIPHWLRYHTTYHDGTSSDYMWLADITYCNIPEGSQHGGQKLWDPSLKGCLALLCQQLTEPVPELC